MRLFRAVPLFAALAIFAACDRGPTEPTIDAELDTVDPYVLTFNATSGLPGEPFHAEKRPPSPHGGFGPGGRFPDSLQLTDAQKAAIQALVDTFNAAHQADLAALKAIHEQARAAHLAGKTRDEVKAILATAKPILERMRSAFEALKAAVDAVLTPAQKAWIASHKPAAPPPRPKP